MHLPSGNMTAKENDTKKETQQPESEAVQETESGEVWTKVWNAGNPSRCYTRIVPMSSTQLHENNNHLTKPTHEAYLS